MQKNIQTRHKYLLSNDIAKVKELKIFKINTGIFPHKNILFFISNVRKFVEKKW